ncbi:MAG: dipeptide epimerase [Mitsuaria chitosanitabida]|uniref:dipeptide epimerase n=1 Tax=Roseateles chitosanitabidus TaxID=65048 RepID=UPI001B0E96E7|nr:dipeptide epimerase [Roseateles chitosanitabidus]MBO9688207.1 dipeptide epimerase [Roseateles chitosanitabidus]
MQIDSWVEEIPFKAPLAIAGRTLVGQSVLRVTGRHAGLVAEAEAAGVFYHGDDGHRMRAQVQEVLPRLGEDLPTAWRAVRAMRPGGARNALDWVMWQLAAGASGRPVHELAFLSRLRPLATMVTLGLASASRMAQAALALPEARMLKLKLEGTEADAERVTAVRRARPDVRLGIDANEGWTLGHLERMTATLLAQGVELIEQPLPASRDDELAGYRSPIPLAADESLQTLDDLDQVATRYQVANIKLDKCGGLSAALTLANEARQRGMRVMIGCMGGRSLAILPAFIAAQTADLVDLDAPLFMAGDTAPAARYAQGQVSFDVDALDVAAPARRSPVSAWL